MQFLNCYNLKTKKFLKTLYYANLLYSRTNAFHQVFRKIKAHEVKKICFLDDLTWNGSLHLLKARLCDAFILRWAVVDTALFENTT